MLPYRHADPAWSTYLLACNWFDTPLRPLTMNRGVPIVPPSNTRCKHYHHHLSQRVLLGTRVKVWHGPCTMCPHGHKLAGHVALPGAPGL